MGCRLWAAAASCDVHTAALGFLFLSQHRRISCDIRPRQSLRALWSWNGLWLGKREMSRSRATFRLQRLRLEKPWTQPEQTMAGSNEPPWLLLQGHARCL